MQFIISTTDDVLLPQSGLALVGALLQGTKLRQRIDALNIEGCARPEVKHGDVVAAAIGLLCLGKSDFNDIEAFRDDPFFRLSLGLLAYNILRLCGQGALREQRRLPAEERAPLKKKVFRRRLRSVIQDLMYLAAQLVRHAHRWQVVFYRNSPWGATWRGLYARFAGAPRRESG